MVGLEEPAPHRAADRARRRPHVLSFVPRTIPHAFGARQRYADSSSRPPATAPSWRSRRSGASIIDTNGARPERSLSRPDRRARAAHTECHRTTLLWRYNARRRASVKVATVATPSLRLLVSTRAGSPAPSRQRLLTGQNELTPQPFILWGGTCRLASGSTFWHAQGPAGGGAQARRVRRSGGNWLVVYCFKSRRSSLGEGQGTSVSALKHAAAQRRTLAAPPATKIAANSSSDGMFGGLPRTVQPVNIQLTTPNRAR